MAMNSLKDVYVDQLQDIYSALSQSGEVTKKLADAAKNEDLKKALQAGAEGIHNGMEAVKKLARTHDFDPEGEHCKGMEGLVNEARAHGLEQEFGDEDAQDAMIISQYQRMAHYGIAAWGTVKAFATRLGLDDDATLIDEHLGHTYDGDEHMTAIATQDVNKAAA